MWVLWVRIKGRGVEIGFGSGVQGSGVGQRWLRIRIQGSGVRG